MTAPTFVFPTSVGSGATAKPLAPGIGNTFIVASSTYVSECQALYPAERGVSIVYTSVTSALADCQTNHGDVIYIDPSYTTALTAADLLNAETKGVAILPMGPSTKDGNFVAYRATATLPQGTHASIFTVTGRVKLVDIIGVVTTAIGVGANNTKLTAYPTAAGLSSVDICAVANTASDAVATPWSITGTFATALVHAANGAFVYQAAPVVLEAGALHLDCAGSNTGSVKWAARYQPLDAGARMIAA